MTQKIEGNLPTAATLRTAATSSKIASAGEDGASPVAVTPPTDSVKLTGEAPTCRTCSASFRSPRRSTPVASRR